MGSNSNNYANSPLPDYSLLTRELHKLSRLLQALRRHGATGHRHRPSLRP